MRYIINDDDLDQWIKCLEENEPFSNQYVIDEIKEITSWQDREPNGTNKRYYQDQIKEALSYMIIRQEVGIYDILAPKSVAILQKLITEDK